MQTSTEILYNEYSREMRRIADIRYSSALLQWDQETYLPPKAAGIRGQQIATLTEIAHRFFIEEKLGDLLLELLGRGDLKDKRKRNIELTWEDYSKQKKFTSAFVRTMSEAVNKSFHSWLRARKINDFKIFRDDLSVVIELKKQEAELLGFVNNPYDALLNDHDKGSNVQMLNGIFDGLKDPLKQILESILSKPQVEDSFLYQHFPRNLQWEFGMTLLRDLGFDFEAGRQDISEHPFSTSFGSKDVRITTRINENDIASMTWSCIHELGHALYEQGLPEDEYGLPLGEAASYSIHESQSRLWENHIGRSRSFCEKYFPLLQRFFPEQLSEVSADQFYKAINKVQPSLIRTEADELTYHFHIMIRFEIEQQLINGALVARDIPEYWNNSYKEYLGTVVQDDKTGCLQDVHWSHGSFGYFPTYSLGSFYSAQLYTILLKKQPFLEENVKKGDMRPLIEWLREEVYQHGRRFTSNELCKEITGQPLQIQHFLSYLLDKYKNIYNF